MTAESANHTTRPMTEHTVLLVDDEPQIIEAMKLSLRKEPYRVVGVTDGRAALQIMADNPIEVIVSDEDMPGMHGTELLAAVRDRYPDTLRVVLTGRGSFNTAVHAINQGGVFRYLIKPCPTNVLAEVIREAITFYEKRARETRALTALARQRELILVLNAELEQSSAIEPPEATPKRAVQKLEDKLERLTARERELLNALSQGTNIRDVAGQLGISLHTARNHLKAILRKCEVHSQVELLGKLFSRDA